MKLRDIFLIITIAQSLFTLPINTAMPPAEKTFTIVNASDKPIEIVYINEINLWRAKGSNTIEINTGTYSRSILPGDVLLWNKIIGEPFTTQTLDPGKSLVTHPTYRTNPDTPAIVGPLWVIKDKPYRYDDFMNLLELFSRHNKVRLDAKPHETGFYKLTTE